MSDHEFEKQVQLKMEQLKLRPSSAVWAGVENNIRRDKRRRRMLVWLPLLLLLLGAGGYLALEHTNKQAPNDLAQQQSTIPSPVHENSKPSNSTATQNTDPNNQPVTANDQQPVNPASAVTATPTGQAPLTANTATAPAVDPVNKPAAIPATKPVAEAASPVRAPSLKVTDRFKAKTSYTSGNRLVGNHPPKKRPTAKKPVKDIATNNNTPGEQGQDGVAMNNVIAQPVADTATAVTTLVVPDSAVAQASIADSLSKDSTALAAAPAMPAAAQVNKPAPVNQKSTSKWQFGLQAEGGYSGVTKEGLFGFLESSESPVADLAAPNFSNATNAFAPQFPRPVNKASNLTMGPSFSISGFAQYEFSKRLSLSAGIQYTYLSARQVVGSKVNNNRTVNRAPYTSQLVSSYYDANSAENYTNKYHFLEIPVTLHTQLNKSERLPIIWDFGVSLGKLLNTNALHYDGIGGVYYKDESLLRKIQWAVSTGFGVKLFPQSGHPLTVGPVMRYNMSPLLKKDITSGQHLWSVGVRASILLKK